jgi:hypothetical protein
MEAKSQNKIISTVPVFYTAEHVNGRVRFGRRGTFTFTLMYAVKALISQKVRDF